MGTVIVDIETYTDEVIVHLNEEGTEKDADTLFDEIFDKKYENEKHRILLDLSDEYLNVIVNDVNSFCLTLGKRA